MVESAPYWDKVVAYLHFFGIDGEDFCNLYDITFMNAQELICGEYVLKLFQDISHRENAFLSDQRGVIAVALKPKNIIKFYFY